MGLWGWGWGRILPWLPRGQARCGAARPAFIALFGVMGQEIFHGAESETGREPLKREGGMWQSQPTKPSRVKLIGEDGGGAGAGAGSAPPAPRARSSAQGGSGSAAPRRASGRGAVCKRAPAKSCSKNDKPSGKWTHGAARMYFFIFDNLCPKETILKIIEMITIHCCLTLSRNSRIMKS